ncbi:hypothetical protein EZS27_040019, partial [termite gut metagenome]
VNPYEEDMRELTVTFVIKERQIQILSTTHQNKEA